MAYHCTHLHGLLTDGSKPGKANIVQIAQAVNAGPLREFEYLLAAAQCDYFGGAVVALLSGTNKYTLFAPTDAAFERLLGGPLANPSDICAAFADDPSALFNVLAYHVTDGRRFSNSVFNKRATKMVEMLNGHYIVTNPNLTIDDNAGQTIRPVVVDGAALVNINASNGVIHVIGTVLLP